MRILFFLVFAIFGVTTSYSQYDCSQGDGTFRYEVKLYITNVPIDFDKDDLIAHIVSLDDISTEDLNTLTQHIIVVYKTLPSLSSHTTVSVIATTEIYSLLDSLNNSIEFQYCVLNDCITSDGDFNYIVLPTLLDVPNDFDKEDLISFIIGNDTISTEDLATLNDHITSVYKAFPSAQSQFLQRVLYIEATAELFEILDDLDNTIEHHSCDEEAILYVSNQEKIKNVIVYPNPVSEDSVIELNIDTTEIRLQLINSLGEIYYEENFFGKETIKLSTIPVANGLSFLNIYNPTDGSTSTLKIVK